jgi:adenylate cyclase
VRYVVEGSVQKASDRIRVYAQLIDAATGYHLWADRFDHRLEDVFELQDQVTSDILAALQVEISEAEEQRLARRYTDSVQAYEEFLKGWEQLFVGTLESIRRARAHFERAIQIDPRFARAYANLALTYTSTQAGLVMPDASLERAQQLVQKAIELDDTLPQVYWVLAFVKTQLRAYDEALAAIDAAIALDPNNADAYANQAYIMHLRGQPEEAVRLIEQAMRLNPRYPALYLEELGKAQFALERYQAAAATLERVRERNPNMWTTRLFLAGSYAETGRVDEAEWEIVEVLAADPGLSLAKLGDYVPYEKPADLARLVHALERAWPRE